MKFKFILFCVFLALMSVSVVKAQDCNYFEDFDEEEVAGSITNSASPGQAYINADDGYLLLKAISATGGRNCSFIFPQAVNFQKTLIVEFDLWWSGAVVGTNNEAQILFRNGNDALFSMYSMTGRTDEIGFVAGALTDRAETFVDEANRTVVSATAENWYHVTVEYYAGYQIKLTITDDDDFIESKTIPLPAGGNVLSGIDRVHFNCIRGSNLSWEARVDNLCITAVEEEAPPCDYFEDFDEATLNGTITHNGGSNLSHDRTEGNLFFANVNQSGGRRSFFNLNPTIPFNDELVVEFDWWSSAFTGGSDGNEGQCQFRSGDYVLFTIYNQRSNITDNLTFAVGNLADWGMAEGLDASQRKTIDTSVETWYHVKAEIFAGDRISFTVTGEEVDEQFDIPLLSDFPIWPSLTNLYFVAFRNGGNIYWNARLDNLCVNTDFADESFKLSFDTQVEEIKNPDDKVVSYRKTIGELPSVTRTDYSFEGWNSEPDGAGDKYTSETVFAFKNDVTVYAQWAIVYTLKFNTQTNEVANPANKTVTYDKPVGALTSPYWIGYDFSGWNTEEDGSGDTFTAETVYTFETDITLYAQWTEWSTVEAFTEDFSSPTAELKGSIIQGGLAGTSNTFLFHDRSAENGNFLRFQFDGQSGNRSSIFALNSNVLFEKKAVVEFDWWTAAFGGTAGAEGHIQFRNGTNVLFSMFKIAGSANQIGVVAGPLSGGNAAPVDEAYRYSFLETTDSEWNHVKVEIFAGSTIVFTITREDTDFDAKTITLPLPDGSIEKGINNILFDAIRVGSIGWNTRLTNLDIKAADDDAPSNTFVLSFDIQSDIDVSTPSKQLVTGGEPVGKLPDLYKPGYSFDGWNTEADGSGDMITATTIYSLNTDATLYAIWGTTGRFYLITFDSQVEDIENPDDKRVTFNQPIGLLPTLVREGFRFTGWYTEMGARIYAELNYVFERDITLLAQWLDVSGYDYYEPFDVSSVNDLQGTFTHGGGTVLNLDVLNGYLSFNCSTAQSGGRDSRFSFTKAELPLTISYTKKLAVDFDWWSSDFTGGANDEGQVQFRNGEEVLFTIFNARGDVNRLGFAVGPLSGNLALSGNPLYFTKVDLASREWYNVKVEIYLGQRVDFTLTDKDGEVTDVSLSLPAEFAVTAINNLWFRGTRTSDFTWNCRLDNLGIRVADDDPPVISYMINFDTQSSVERPSPKKVTFDAPVGKLPELTRTGYIFDGWNTKADGTGIPFTGATVYEYETDISLYAQWIPNTYTIFFDTQTSEVTNPADKTVNFDALVGQLPAVIRTGFRFDGWSNLPDGTYINIFTEETKYTYNKDTTLYALWIDNREAFTLSFDAQFEGIENPETVQVAQGKAIGRLFGDLPVLTRDGYSFVGWFTQEEGKGQKIMDYTLYTFNRNMTVYAFWVEIEPVDYTGYNYFEDFEDVEDHEFITISGNGGARPDEFIKGSRGVIKNGTGGPISIFNIDENKSLRIFANGSGQRMAEFWLPDTLTASKKLVVEFDFWTSRFNGFSTAEGQIWFMSKDSLALFTMFVLPEASGSTRTQLGVATGLKPVYANITNPSSGLMINNDQSFIKASANCSGTLIDLPVSQVSRPAGLPQVDNVSVWYHVTVEFYPGQYMKFLITNPHYRGELFLPLPEGFTANSLTAIAMSGLRHSGGDNNWEARIDNLGVDVDGEVEEPIYLLNFDLNLDEPIAGVTKPDSKPVKQDEEVGELPVPLRPDGFVFAGWFLNPEGTGDPVTATTVYTFDHHITLYAQWQETSDVYTISFDTQVPEIENPEDKRVIYNEQVGSELLGMLPVVVRSGYTFKEWNTETDGSGDAISNNTYYLYQEDITVYAIWVANTYLLKFDTQAMASEVTTPADKSVTFDEPVGALPSLSRTNYTFDGWFTAATGGTKYEPTTVYKTAGDLTLYAHWTNTGEPSGVSELLWKDLIVYPNPVFDVLTISGLESGDIIAIFDLGGRNLMNTKASGGKDELSVGNLPQGTYLVKITRGNAEKSIKIIVK